MKTKLIGLLAASLMAAPAFAGKVADYGNPSYNNCNFNLVYGNGGGGVTYLEYDVSCDGGHYFTVGETEYQGSCTYTVSSGYEVSGVCDNWEVYTD